MPDLTTRLIHLPQSSLADYAAQPMPVCRASTTFFPNVAALRARNWRDPDQYPYGLSGTPSTRQLERQISQLEGGEYALLVPSGLAAISLINLACLKQGDEVLLPSNAYGPGIELAAQLLTQYGISYRLYDAMQPEALTFQANTRLIWLEAAGSVTMEFPHLGHLAQRARKQGVLSVLDNTWGAGLAFSAFALPDGAEVDISMQALTKYPSGGADLLMGSIVTRNESLYHTLRHTFHLLGLGISPADADLILRQLPTLRLRYQAQDRTARHLAQWLRTQAPIVQVLHPALPDSPGHQHWLAHTRGQGAASLLSLVFPESISQDQIDQFCDHLQLFRVGFSWGGPMSLVVPYDLQQLRGGAVPDHLHGPRLVRLVIGLEHADDLAADLTQALRHAFNVSPTLPPTFDTALGESI